MQLNSWVLANVGSCSLYSFMVAVSVLLNYLVFDDHHSKIVSVFECCTLLLLLLLLFTLLILILKRYVLLKRNLCPLLVKYFFVLCI